MKIKPTDDRGRVLVDLYDQSVSSMRGCRRHSRILFFSLFDRHDHRGVNPDRQFVVRVGELAKSHLAVLHEWWRMTCRSCTEARRASKASIQSFARGDMKAGATRAKEAAGHIAAKAKDEAARVRGLLARKP